MAQNLLTTGTGEASSVEFTLDGQQEATLSLKSSSTSGGVPSNALVYIEIKDNGTSFWPVNVLTSSQKMVLLTATGTYRVRRSSSSGEVGVFYTLGDTSVGGGGGGGTTNGLTDTQLRAAAVSVTGPVTNTELRAAALPVSGPLTDTQLRANPVPISGTVTTGGLTDTQLRATAVPISLASAPLPSGGSTSALQTTGNTSLASIVTALAGLLKVNTLAQPANARQLALSTTSASVQLTAGVTRISIAARNTEARYRITAATSTAVATDHFIASGERLDLAVPSNYFLSVLGVGTGTLEITELI